MSCNVAAASRASGRVDSTTRTITPACTVPLPYVMCTGIEAVTPAGAFLDAEICSLPELDNEDKICSEEVPPEE